MGELNIQLCPTPIFYVGVRSIFRLAQEQPAAICSAGIVSAFIFAGVPENVSDAAGSVASIVFAITGIPHNESTADESETAATISSALNTSSNFQRNAGVDQAVSRSGIVSAFIFTQRNQFAVDSGNAYATIVSASHP